MQSELIETYDGKIFEQKFLREKNWNISEILVNLHQKEL